MAKMHLRAKVPNEGARRLAHFLGKGGALAIEHFAAALPADVSVVDRLLSGELEPGGEIAHRAWLATDGDIWRTDWRTPARGSWFEVPAERAFNWMAA